jgi:geranylgeranyl diphosphate synthase type II
MTREQLMDVLHRDAALVEEALSTRTVWVDCLAQLTCDEQLTSLHEAQNYSLMAGGKRIRPALALEVCDALGGERHSALPFACAVEMIHTYSLIHDDLPCMDNDDMRRGKPTSHRMFGEATAILAGDGLLTDAFSVAASHADEKKALAAVRVLASAAGSVGIVGGQIMDMRGESEQLSLQALLQLHARKTGAIICAAVQTGAIAAGYTPQNKEWQALTTYAQSIGLAFQVVDDILDVTADPVLLGKSKGKDSAENKTTFLTYYTVDEARDYARRLTEQAIAAVEPIDKQGTLRALALYLSERVY